LVDLLIVPAVGLWLVVSGAIQLAVGAALLVGYRSRLFGLIGLGCLALPITLTRSTPPDTNTSGSSECDRCSQPSLVHNTRRIHILADPQASDDHVLEALRGEAPQPVDAVRDPVQRAGPREVVQLLSGDPGLGGLRRGGVARTGFREGVEDAHTGGHGWRSISYICDVNDPNDLGGGCALCGADLGHGSDTRASVQCEIRHHGPRRRARVPHVVAPSLVVTSCPSSGLTVLLSA